MLIYNLYITLTFILRKKNKKRKKGKMEGRKEKGREERKENKWTKVPKMLLLWYENAPHSDSQYPPSVWVCVSLCFPSLLSGDFRILLTVLVSLSSWVLPTVFLPCPPALPASLQLCLYLLPTPHNTHKRKEVSLKSKWNFTTEYTLQCYKSCDLTLPN